MELDPIYYNATRKLAILKTKIFLDKQFHQNWSFQLKAVEEPIFNADTHIFKKELNLKKKELKASTKVVTKKPKPKKKVTLPIQPLPIDINNFFIRTKGEFKEVQKIPINFLLFFESKGSKYYTNKAKTRLIRVSDHWGHNIRFCCWDLIGYPKVHCGQWKSKVEEPNKIGIINFNKLVVNI